MAATELGSTIQRLLRERRMKPIELARRADIDRGQLSRILQGRSKPSIESLERIAEALGVASGSLLEGETHEVHDVTAQLQRDPSLTFALRSLQKLNDSDKKRVIEIIQRFAASAPSDSLFEAN